MNRSSPLKLFEVYTYNMYIYILEGSSRYDFLSELEEPFFHEIYENIKKKYILAACTLVDRLEPTNSTMKV